MPEEIAMDIDMRPLGRAGQPADRGEVRASADARLPGYLEDELPPDEVGRIGLYTDGALVILAVLLAAVALIVVVIAN